MDCGLCCMNCQSVWMSDWLCDCVCVCVCVCACVCVCDCFCVCVCVCVLIPHLIVFFYVTCSNQLLQQTSLNCKINLKEKSDFLIICNMHLLNHSKQTFIVLMIFMHMKLKQHEIKHKKRKSKQVCTYINIFIERPAEMQSIVFLIPQILFRNWAK